VASLQERSGSWRVIFRFRGLQHFVTIGEAEETEAQGVKARYEYLLRLLKQRLLTLPSGMDIVTFLRLDGKPGDPAASTSPEVPASITTPWYCAKYMSALLPSSIWSTYPKNGVFARKPRSSGRRRNGLRISPSCILT